LVLAMVLVSWLFAFFIALFAHFSPSAIL